MGKINLQLIFYLPFPSKFIAPHSNNQCSRYSRLIEDSKSSQHDQRLSVWGNIEGSINREDENPSPEVAGMLLIRVHSWEQ